MAFGRVAESVREKSLERAQQQLAHADRIAPRNVPVEDGPADEQEQAEALARLLHGMSAAGEPFVRNTAASDEAARQTLPRGAWPRRAAPRSRQRPLRRDHGIIACS